MKRISLLEVRPSGHTVRIHSEEWSCTHEQEHLKLILKFLDVIAYDCGARRGEFQELKDRVEKIKQLTNELAALIPRSKTSKPKVSFNLF